MTDNVLDFKSSVIIEENDEDLDSLFDLDDEKNNTESTIATQGFEKDLDIDEMNFNLIRNSNAFKTKSKKDEILSVIEDDEQPKMG